MGLKQELSKIEMDWKTEEKVFLALEKTIASLKKRQYEHGNGWRDAWGYAIEALDSEEGK